MVNQVDRLDTLIKPAISKLSKDKIFIDMGCGMGLLGLYALSCGAKFVYFVEQDLDMFKVLAKVIPTKISKDKFKLINRHVEKLSLDDFNYGFPDTAVSEFYGPNLFDEGYVAITKYVKSLLPEIKFIPEIFKIDFYINDVDYTQPIWPNDLNLVDFYKVLYENHGFNDNIECKLESYIGSINFNANTQIFENNINFLCDNDEDKLLIGNKVILQDNLSQNFGTLGWFINRKNKNKMFNIYSDEVKYFRLFIKEIKKK